MMMLFRLFLITAALRCGCKGEEVDFLYPNNSVPLLKQEAQLLATKYQLLLQNNKITMLTNNTTLQEKIAKTLQSIINNNVAFVKGGPDAPTFVEKFSFDTFMNSLINQTTKRYNAKLLRDAANFEQRIDNYEPFFQNTNDDFLNTPYNTSLYCTDGFYEDPDKIIGPMRDTSLPSTYIFPYSLDRVSYPRQCNDEWVVPALLLVTSHYAALFGNNKARFSANEMISCMYPRTGCDGGNIEDVFRRIVNTGALRVPFNQLDSTVYDSKQCINNFLINRQFINGWYKVPNNINQIKLEIKNRGPVLACTSALDIAYYSSGVFNRKVNKCDTWVLLYGWSNAVWYVQYLHFNWGSYGRGYISMNTNSIFTDNVYSIHLTKRHRITVNK